jgi:deoxyribonuclease V
MLVALDVAYSEAQGYAVAIAFADWTSDTVSEVYTATIDDVPPYEPGAFYKRELPCLLAVLAQVPLPEVQCLVVDGYVTLGPDSRPGLGTHLYHALGSQLPVIGVAKTRFAGVGPQVAPVLRGQSANPLYVSSIGIALADAAALVQQMHGAYRFPTLLKYLDDLTKKTI